MSAVAGLSGLCDDAYVQSMFCNVVLASYSVSFSFLSRVLRSNLE